MRRPTLVEASLAAAAIAGLIYNTLGKRREISAFLGQWIFSTPITVPELIALSVPGPGIAMPVLMIVVLVTLPPLHDAHLQVRRTSRTRAATLPLGPAATLAGMVVVVWAAIVVVLAAPAVWENSWNVVDPFAVIGVGADRDPSGFPSPLLLLALTLLNYASTLFAIATWTGLVAQVLSRRGVTILLMVLTLVYLAVGLNGSLSRGIRRVIGDSSVLHDLPAGWSSISIVLGIGLIPLLITSVLDARRSRGVSVRPLVLVGAATLVLTSSLALGSALDVVGRWGQALLLHQEGARAGIDGAGSLAGFAMIQVLTLAPALVMLTRSEEAILLWPMVRVRGAATGRWLASMLRQILGLSVLVASFPVLSLAVATLGAPDALSMAKPADLHVVAYLWIATVLQTALVAVLLTTVRMVTSSVMLWVITAAVLLCGPFIIPLGLFPLGLNHLVVIPDEPSGGFWMLPLLLSLALGLTLTTAACYLALRRLPIDSEV